jgi:hypothetical protein
LKQICGGLARNLKMEIQICISTKLQTRNKQLTKHTNMLLEPSVE